jgi:hypothetical protein
MGARDWMIVAAWTGGILTLLICLFCLTRSPIEILGDLYDWARTRRPRVTRSKYSGRRRYVEGADGGQGDTPLDPGQADSGSDTKEEEVAA